MCWMIPWNRSWRSHAGVWMVALAGLVLLSVSTPTRAEVLDQRTTPATLEVINESSATICEVYISAVTGSSWEDNWLGEETIPPGDVHQFELPRGRYNVQFKACEGAVLFEQRERTISRPDELRLTEFDRCITLIERGSESLHLSQYQEALQQLEDALTCFRGIDHQVGEAATLHNIGSLYGDQEQYEQALGYYEQALVIWQELSDQEGEGSTLNNIGYIYLKQEQYAKALEHLEKALVIRREIGDQEGEAETLSNIGQVYVEQARFGEALEYYEQELIIELELGDLANIGTALSNIGVIYDESGRYTEALEYYEQSLVIRREIGDRSGEATILSHIGDIHLAQGRFEEALSHHQEALVIRQQLNDRAGEAVNLNEIGLVYRNQGRYTEALTYYERALALRREVGDRPGEGVTLNNIGMLYWAQGQYATALEHLERAQAIQREVGDPGDEGDTITNIGTVYYSQGRYDEALATFEQALALFQQVGDRVGEAIAVTNIGLVHWEQGRYAKALENYEQALEIRRESGDRAGEATTLNNIGTILDAQGQPDEALAYYEQALFIAREVGNRDDESITLNNLGFLYWSQGQDEEALAHYEQALAILQALGDEAGIATVLSNIGVVLDAGDKPAMALAYYEQAMDKFESVRSVAGDDLARASFIGQHINLYSRAIALYHQEGQDEAAFITSERGRARSFLDSLATGQVQLADHDAALLAAEQQAYAVRQAAQDALARAQAADPPDAALIADLQAQLAEAETAYDAALTALEQQGERATQLASSRQLTVTVADVQAQLDDQTTLVSYWVLPEDQGSLAFVVTHNEFTVVELPLATREAISQMVTALHSWSNVQSAHPRPLRTLYDWLVAPLEARLQTAHLLIVPHQQLHYVPFTALTDGEAYLGDHHTLAVVPSAGALPYIAENALRGLARAEAPAALVFGNPTLGEPALPPLEYAEQEAQAVGTLFASPVYTGSQATELRLREAISGAAIVHLAAHGEYNAVNALYSTIYLAPDSTPADQPLPPEQDGRLEVHEVYGLPLQGSELVTLSACETALGGLTPGDEVVGLTRAFFFAGAPTVITTLWKVDDAATERLMVSFYRHWLAGMSKAEALQAAQAEVRANPAWVSPYFWAAFTLNGDGGAGSAPVKRVE